MFGAKIYINIFYARTRAENFLPFYTFLTKKPSRPPARVAYSAFMRLRA